MSPADISRIQSIGGARSIARDAALPSDKRTDSASKAVARPPENAIKLETGQAVDAGQAPVDNDRVQQIRAAVNSGTYPLVPARIADAMIAAPLLLGVDA